VCATTDPGDDGNRQTGILIVSAVAAGLLAGAAVAFFIVRRRQHAEPPNERAERLLSSCYDLIDKIDKRLHGIGVHLPQAELVGSEAQE